METTENALDRYIRARERAVRFDDIETVPLSPAGRSEVYVHNGPTEDAVVLFHGLTNCAQQFRALASDLHGAGATVFIPRLPRHGRVDRRKNALERVSAEELRECATSALEIATGLGRRVTVAGLSAGGVMAAWLAQFRPEVARSVVIAPSFAFGGRIGVMAGDMQGPLLRLLPNFGLERFGDPKDILDHAYFNFPSRALGQVMLMGAEVRRAALRQAPRAASIQVILNEADTAVNDDVTIDLIKRWRRAGYDGLTVRELPRERNLIHDIIDPAQRKQQTAYVYPILLDAILGDRGPSLPNPA
ncbi:MAG TPA: alpha/beta fold hydrolase [Ktedonobacterales bacterium]